MPKDEKKEDKKEDEKDKGKEKDKDGKEKDGEKKGEKKEPEKPKDPRTKLVDDLRENLTLIADCVATMDVRGIGRVTRNLNSLRKQIAKCPKGPEVLRGFLEVHLTEKSGVDKALLTSYVPDVEMQEASPPPKPSEEKKTEGDKTEDGDKKKEDDEEKKEPLPPEKEFAIDLKTSLPEVEAFFGLLVLTRILREKRTDDGFNCANHLVAKMKQSNRRSLDPFLARGYFYLAYVYELKGRSAEIRSELMGAYRTACLRHDPIGQATLLNMILRNYLQFNLYEQALKLVSKTVFPESRSNAQYARYLYYLGRIKAVQLEYSDAHSKLTQAIRKAPQSSNVALGFKLAATKLAVIVELLMGGIPDRNTFLKRELKEKLKPYYAITQAVRTGDLTAFSEVMKEHGEVFKRDKMLTLIHRLRYNVIKTGLRRINVAYSRISLEDVREKLGLETAQDAAGIVAKAVVDGVIEAMIDYDGRCLQSDTAPDLYASAVPQQQLNKRVCFCLQLHNDAVKAMEYPDDKLDRAGTAQALREREKEQLAAAEEDMDDDMDML